MSVKLTEEIISAAIEVSQTSGAWLVIVDL